MFGLRRLLRYRVKSVWLLQIVELCQKGDEVGDQGRQLGTWNTNELILRVRRRSSSLHHKLRLSWLVRAPQQRVAQECLVVGRRPSKATTDSLIITEAGKVSCCPTVGGGWAGFLGEH